MKYEGYKIGPVIRDIRKDKGLLIEEVAAKTGISVSTLGQVEQGGRNLSMKNLYTWVGKKASIVEANKPIRKTLRLCPEESANWDETENLYGTPAGREAVDNAKGKEEVI